MSTNIFDKSAHARDRAYIRLFAMPSRQQQTEDLADFIRRVRSEKNVSLGDIEIQSGGMISRGYVGHIENRQVLGQNMTVKKLQALAKGLGIPEDTLFGVARNGNQRGDLAEKGAHFIQALPKEQQEDAVEILETLYKKHGRPVGNPPRRRIPKDNTEFNTQEVPVNKKVEQDNDKVEPAKTR